MPGKIILITPPDIFENNNKSILFVSLNSEDQSSVSKWLGELNFDHDINFYVYNDELDVKWLLWAVAASKHTYLDIDNLTYIPKHFCAYLLSKNNVFYNTKDENLAALFSHINTGRVKNIESFLERIFNE